MVKRIAIVLGIAIGMLLFLAIAFVVTVVLTAEQSAGGATLSTGRSVSASGKVWQSFSMQSQGDTETITSGGRTIVVAPTSLIVDGRVVAPIAATAMNVVVRVHGREVSFTVDGKPIVPVAKGQNSEE